MKHFRNIVCILLVIVMGILSPASVIAAGPKYIADVMVYVADSFEKAKTGLADLGYEIVKDSNLNATLSTGVYLGYKTTDDPNEAITDIAAMNMTGNYSYSDYKELMKKYRNQVENTIRGFETALAEFQTNFTNGTPEAQMAYDSINLYRDDDSGKLMGDYLLDYDFSQKAQEQLTDTIMQANSDIVMAIMQNVSMASDAEDTSMLERLAASDPDTILDDYLGVYLTPAKAQHALEKDLGATEKALRLWWDIFYDYLVKVETDDFTINADGIPEVKDGVLSITSSVQVDKLPGLTAEQTEYMSSMTNLTSAGLKEKTIQDITLYMLLAELTCKSGSMLDFFKRPLSEVSQNELYAVADAMSKGQRGQLEILGLRAILLNAGIELDENSAEAQEAVADNTEEKENIEPISIFEGVDRSVFTDGTALTGSAVRHEQQTGENWITKLTGIQMSEQQYDLSMGILFSTITAVGTAAAGITAAYMEGKLVEKAAAAAKASSAAENAAWNATKARWEEALKLYKEAPIAAAKFKETEIQIIKRFNFTEEIKSEMIRNAENAAEELIAERTANYNNMLNELRDVTSPSAAAANGKGATEAVSKTSINAAKITKCVSFILFAIALIVDVVFIYELLNTDAPAEEKIPHHLLAAVDTEYGEDYVYYATVKNQNGEPADVNNHEGDKSIGWLVLYQTKERSAGKPILVKDLRVQKGSSNVDEDGAFVHLFDQLGALNLTDPRFTGRNDNVKGTYILFSRDANAFAGSAISGGIAALCTASGLIVGLAGGFLITGRKKKAINMESCE